MSLNQNIKDGLLASGSFLKTGSRNTPKQYKDRNTQYFEAETLKYISQYAKYSSAVISVPPKPVPMAVSFPSVSVIL